MRALLLTAVNELQVTTVPDPVPSAGEVPLRAAGAEARLERGDPCGKLVVRMAT